LAGAFIEGIATLLCRLASKTLSEKGPKYAQILDSFIGTSLVVAGNEKSFIQRFKFKFKVKSLKVLKHHMMYFMFLSIILSFLLISSFEAFNYSGGYFNPVLSTSLKWGCAGHTEIEHVIVYWIGACAGAIVSVPLFKHPIVRKLLLGTDDAKVKDE
jgi:aquaporin related protein